MVSTPARSTHPPTSRTAHPLLRLAVWPFTSRVAAPLWLLVRLYLAYVWFTMGYSKLSAGFLSADPIGDLLRLAGDGVMLVPLEAYRPVARLLVDLGITPLLSHTMPFLEMALAVAFVSGVLIVPAALGATFLNLNFLLSGVAIASLDLRVIALQLLLVLAWRVAGTIGVRRPLAGALTSFGARHLRAT